MKKTSSEPAFDLFADIEEPTPEVGSTENQGELDIITFQATGKTKINNFMQLFEGYTVLKVITYSSSEAMIRTVIKNFDSVEIIFGNESVLGSIKEKLTEQYALLKNIQEENNKSKDLIFTKIASGALSLFVTKLNEHTSHQKIYLLSNDAENKYRVITGSANFSLKAFSGNQLETICVADDFATYEIYRDIYENTKGFSTQKITAESIKEISFNELEKLPAIQEIKDVKMLVVEEAPDIETVDQYVMRKEEFNKFIKDKNIDLGKIESNKDGARILLYENVKKVFNDVKLAFKEKQEVYKSYPQFYIDVNKLMPVFNDEPMNINDIDEQKVINDVALFKKFFAGYFDPDVRFSGDIITNVRKYYATINFAFCSPFISVTRFRTPPNIEKINYPLYLLLRGTTNAGKTFLMKFILHTMFNQYKLNIHGKNSLIQTANSEDNSPAKLQKKMPFCMGMPLMVDEVNNKRWTEYGERFIKTDHIVDEHLSAIIFATNDVGHIDEALNKRSIAFDISITTPRETNLRNNPQVASLENMTGELYKLYLQKMLAAYPTFLEAFNDSKRKFAPDIFKLSSMILKDILNQYGYNDEKIVDVYTTTYYLTTANEEEKKQDFIDLYNKCYDEWIINKKHNFIRINFEGQYDARDFQRKYGTELVEWTKGRFVTMPLDKTQEYFGIKIQEKSFFSKIFNK